MHEITESCCMDKRAIQSVSRWMDFNVTEYVTLNTFNVFMSMNKYIK